MDTSLKKPPDPVVLDKSWIDNSRHASSLFWNSSRLVNTNFKPIACNSWFSIKKLSHDHTSIRFREHHENLLLIELGLSEFILLQKIRKFLIIGLDVLEKLITGLLVV